jgi:hypothetical protein
MRTSIPNKNIRETRLYFDVFFCRFFLEIVGVLEGGVFQNSPFLAVRKIPSHLTIINGIGKRDHPPPQNTVRPLKQDLEFDIPTPGR